MRRKKAIHKKKATHRKGSVTQVRPVRTDFEVMETTAAETMGLGPEIAGQTGDIAGLSTLATGNSESVAELVEAGQDLEAELVSGVENAADPDESEVMTHGRRD